MVLKVANSGGTGGVRQRADFCATCAGFLCHAARFLCHEPRFSSFFIAPILRNSFFAMDVIGHDGSLFHARS